MARNDLSSRELNRIKRLARVAGYKTKGEYVTELKELFDRYKLYLCDYNGKLWEIVVMFILGVIQASMEERGIYFWIATKSFLDAAQIDLTVNDRPIQLKWDFSPAAIIGVQDALSFRGITVVGAKKGDDAADVFADILKAAGLSEEEISHEIEVNPGFDAAYDVFDWFSER